MLKTTSDSQQKKSEGKLPQIWRLFPYLVTLTFTCFYFVNAARLDPEPHHDGYLLATAVGSKEGLLPHSEVFNQYGPMSSYLLGLILKLGFAPLLTIRLTIAILLILSALLVVAIMTKVNHPVAGMVGAILWASTSPDWTVTWDKYSFVGQWPWPNVIFSFFVLLSLLLFLHGMEIKNDVTRFSLGVFFSGILMAIAVSTRTTLGILLTLAIGVVFALSYYKRSLSIRHIVTFLLGFGTWLTIFISYLVISNLIDAYLVDTVIGPANATTPTSPLLFLWGVVRPTIGAIVAVTVIYLLYKVLAKYLPSEALTVTLIATSITSFMFAAHEWLRFPKILPGQFFIPWGRDGLFTAQVNVPIYLAFLAVPLLALYMLGKVLKGSTSQDESFSDNELALNTDNLDRFRMLLISVTASSLLFGAYPIADLLHIWWSTPLALAFLMAQVSKLELIKTNSVAFGLAAIFPFILIGTTHVVKQNNVDRIELTSPALSGMLVKKDYYYNFSAADLFFQRHADENLLFMCDDGLFSVWNNRWQSVGPDFVSWSWGARSSVRDDKSKMSNSVIFCSNDVRETSILARSLGLQITDSAVRYVEIGDGETLSSFSHQYFFYAKQVGKFKNSSELFDHPS
jgi:hypothetical protein